MIKIVIFCFVLFGSISFSQVEDFYWSFDACSFSVEYNPNLITGDQLENVVLYLIIGDDFTFHSQYNKKILKEEYEERLNTLKTMEIIRSDFWENIRKKRIEFLTRYFEFKLMIMNYYDDPKVLLKYKHLEEDLRNVAEAIIEEGVKLMNVWENEVKKHMLINGDPEKMYEKFLSQRNSEDSTLLAKDYLFKYSFFNEANRRLPWIHNQYELFEKLKEYLISFDRVEDSH